MISVKPYLTGGSFHIPGEIFLIAGLYFPL